MSDEIKIEDEYLQDESPIESPEEFAKYKADAIRRTLARHSAEEKPHIQNFLDLMFKIIEAKREGGNFKRVSSQESEASEDRKRFEDMFLEAYKVWPKSTFTPTQRERVSLWIKDLSINENVSRYLSPMSGEIEDTYGIGTVEDDFQTYSIIVTKAIDVLTKRVNFDIGSNAIVALGVNLGIQKPRLQMSRRS